MWKLPLGVVLLSEYEDELSCSQSTRTSCTALSVRRRFVLLSVYDEELSCSQSTTTVCPALSVRRGIVLLSVYDEGLSSSQCTTTDCPALRVRRGTVLLSKYDDGLSCSQAIDDRSTTTKYLHTSPGHVSATSWSSVCGIPTAAAAALTTLLSVLLLRMLREPVVLSLPVASAAAAYVLPTGRRRTSDVVPCRHAHQLARGRRNFITARSAGGRDGYCERS